MDFEGLLLRFLKRVYSEMTLLDGEDCVGLHMDQNSCCLVDGELKNEVKNYI